MPTEISYEEKYRRRKPGGLQVRATALESELDGQTGAPLVAAVAKIGRHQGQSVIETLAEGVPFYRSLKAAVPVLSPTTERARQLNITVDPLVVDIDPGHAAGEFISRRN